MPFVAQNKITGERIDVTDFANPRAELDAVHFECRFCKIPMFLRRSPRGTFHFFHQRSCTSDYQHHPETPEHLAGKSFVAKVYLPKLNEYASFNHLFEEPLHAVRRIADIIIKFPMGWWVAHEIQLSSITPEALEERTNDYLNDGVDVIWWLGKSAHTEINRKWVIYKYGFAPCLYFADEEVVAYGYSEKYYYKDEYGLDCEGIKIYRFNLNEDQENLLNRQMIYKIGTWWVELAFARYYQVWKKGNNDRYKRALFANQSAIRSFAGRVGAGNNKRFLKENDLWCVNEEELLPFLKKQNILPLNEVAINSIKEKALKYHSNS